MSKDFAELEGAQLMLTKYQVKTAFSLRLETDKYLRASIPTYEVKETVIKYDLMNQQ